jgi:hypothetical protein
VGRGGHSGDGVSSRSLTRPPGSTSAAGPALANRLIVVEGGSALTRLHMASAASYTHGPPSEERQKGPLGGHPCLIPRLGRNTPQRTRLSGRPFCNS